MHWDFPLRLHWIKKILDLALGRDWCAQQVLCEGNTLFFSFTFFFFYTFHYISTCTCFYFLYVWAPPTLCLYILLKCSWPHAFCFTLQLDSWIVWHFLCPSRSMSPNRQTFIPNLGHKLTVLANYSRKCHILWHCRSSA